MTNKVDRAGAVVLRYSYDADDRLTNRWSAAKGNTGYAYDSLGHLINIHYPASGTVALQYDPLNRVTNMVDSVGTNAYTYTAAGQLLTEDGPFASDTITNTYLNRLRIGLRLQQPAGMWTNLFGYDSARRLTNATSPAGVFGYGYPAGLQERISSIQLPNSAYITNRYDPVSRVAGTFLKNSGGTILDSAVYGYNQAGQRIAFTNASGVYVLYSYDNLGQIKIADSSVNTEDRGYAYDPAWNLNYLTNNGTLTAFQVDQKNELTNAFSAPDSYDANGNLISGTNGHNVYVYDDENRLVQWFWYAASASQCTNGALRTDFAYDGLGRLRKRVEYSIVGHVGGQGPLLQQQPPPCPWVFSSETHYLYDGNRVIQERDGSNTPLVSYTRGTDLSGTMQGAGGIGGLLARSSGYSGGNWTSHAYYHSDGNGNITYLANSSQGLAASYRYDAFGNTVASSGTLAPANVYRFSSKEIHANSGMYYFGYRFYDPNLQRWPNRDPLEEEGGLNLYEFVENNPMSFLDPDGGRPWTFPIPIRLPPGIKPPLPLGPIGAAITCGAIGAAAIDVGSKLYYDEKKKRCDKEWDDAFRDCEKELSKPNPSRDFTGGYNNIMDCARGHVSEDCGGNPLDHGKKKKKPRTIRF